MSLIERRAVRLATDLWATPERVRTVVAAHLETARPTDAAAVISSLEATAGGQRPLPDPTRVVRTERRLAALGARVLLVGRPGYPAKLGDAWPELGAPLWLFARGQADLPQRAVAVVGTRRATADGLATARELGRLLASHGVLVVSGLARGIDQAAHRGALEAGGPTVAVLGTGLDVDYPAGSRSLQSAVVEAGQLLSEYPPGTGPRPVHFLWRNRVIAGLADATVVVEGRARSGALQTARLAAAQGRDVLAVPGSLHAPTARGPLELIRDGARALTSLDEILDVVGLDGTAPGPGEPTVPTLEAGTAAVLDLLGAVPASADQLAAGARLPMASVQAAVAELIALGLAEHTPRGVVRKPHARPQEPR